MSAPTDKLPRITARGWITLAAAFCALILGVAMAAPSAIGHTMRNVTLAEWNEADTTVERAQRALDTTFEDAAAAREAADVRVKDVARFLDEVGEGLVEDPDLIVSLRSASDELAAVAAALPGAAAEGEPSEGAEPATRARVEPVTMLDIYEMTESKSHDAADLRAQASKIRTSIDSMDDLTLRIAKLTEKVVASALANVSGDASAPAHLSDEKLPAIDRIREIRETLGR